MSEPLTKDERATLRVQMEQMLALFQTFETATGPVSSMNIPVNVLRLLDQVAPVEMETFLETIQRTGTETPVLEVSPPSDNLPYGSFRLHPKGLVHAQIYCVRCGRAENYQHDICRNEHPKRAWKEIELKEPEPARESQPLTKALLSDPIIVDANGVAACRTCRWVWNRQHYSDFCAECYTRTADLFSPGGYCIPCLTKRHLCGYQEPPR